MVVGFWEKKKKIKCVQIVVGNGNDANFLKISWKVVCWYLEGKKSKEVVSKQNE